jgi:hypothetical protein
MRCAWILLLAATVLASLMAALGTEGMFQGKVVDPPVSEPVKKGWIYIQGRNHMLRKVEVAHATIFFGQQVPASQQHQCNADCIEVGQEVRVIAEQDANGEWRAKRVEILQLSTNRASRIRLNTLSESRSGFSLQNFTALRSSGWLTNAE